MTKIKKGSSETTREAFCFDLYVKYKPQHKSKVNNYFLQWFIGFSEGKSIFQTWKEKGKQKIAFIIKQKDPKILYWIRTELGFGRVVPVKDCWHYQVLDKKNLHRLYCLFAGNLVLNKKHLDFQKWSLSIVFPLDFSLSSYLKIIENNKYSGASLINLNNAWLSGFFQANGDFHAWSERTRNNEHIVLKISITEQAEVEALQRIGFLINKNLNKNLFVYRNKKSKPLYNSLEFTCSCSLMLFISYFKQFKLYGQQQINFGRFHRIFDMRRKIQNNLIILSEKANLKLNKLIFAIKKQNDDIVHSKI